MAYNVPVCYMYHSHFSQENNKQNKVIERKKSLCCSVIGQCYRCNCNNIDILTGKCQRRLFKG